MNRGYQRRKYLIERSFQLNFILKFCLVAVGAAVSAGIFIVVFSQNSTTVAIEHGRIFAKSTSDFIFPIVALTIFIVTIFSALVVGFLSLLTSHKIAGPIYRIKKEIDHLTKGDLSRNFTIREKDQLQDLAKSLKDMAMALRANRTQMKSAYGELQQFCQDKNASFPESDRYRLAQLLEKLQQSIAQFKD